MYMYIWYIILLKLIEKKYRRYYYYYDVVDISVYKVAAQDFWFK